MKNEALFQELHELDIPMMVTSKGKFTFGIVNSNQNGKRLSFSQFLSHRLGLKDTIALMPHGKARKLVIGKTLPFPKAISASLRGEGKKICYKASLVEMLTNIFDLDFSEHVSLTFDRIEFDDLDGIPVAIVTFPCTASNDSMQSEICNEA